MPGHAFVTINDDQLSIIGPDENTPLFVNDREDEEKKPAGKLYTLFFKIFYILCFLTGQLPIRPAKNDTNRGWRLLCLGGVVLSMALVTLSLLVNVIFALVFNFYVIILCPYKDCGYISTILNMTAILNLTDAMNVTNNSGLQVVQPTKLVIFNDWQKTVVTTATLSGTISFLFMVYVLYSQYSVCRDTFCKCCNSCMNSLWTYFGEEPRERSEGVLLSPFKDDTSSGDTKLAPKQATYFMTIFIFNLLVYGIDVALLFSIFAESVNKNLKIPEIVDGFGLASQFASQFCAILSCFIFSKLAYSVWNTCVHELPHLYTKVASAKLERNGRLNSHQGEYEVQGVDEDEENVTYVVDTRIQSLRNKDENVTGHKIFSDNDICKGSRLHLLKAIANWYSRMLHTTLHPFGTWFAVHWVLYTIAAFMSISYLAETIILELYGSEQPDKECHGERTMHCRLRLAYVFFFAVEHCILFLYPCFRAASVTSAYTSMIKKVSKAEWNNNISLDDKEKFISYLKIQDCTFKISILCAKLSFGFYIAYFSIFVGVFGVILKLAL